MQKKLIFLSFGDIFTFPNPCAIQTNLGTKELLKKTVLENMDYWQNGLEIEKKVCDFKVPLGCLGLMLAEEVSRPLLKTPGSKRPQNGGLVDHQFNYIYYFMCCNV